MDLTIPKEFVQVTKCSTFDILEDGRTVVVLCTTSGQLLEVIDNTVTDSCDIDNEADHIMVFNSYDPLQKYYLLQCQEQLIVVKRSKPLCVIKTFNDVIDVTIEDRLRIGRPQVVIRLTTHDEPIITDFVGQLGASSPYIVPKLTASLCTKLQEMKARVAKVKRLLQEKRSISFKALFRFAPYLQPPGNETEPEQRVLAWGPPPPTPPPPADPPLRFSSVWRKIHNGKWIIGIPVFNESNTAVCDVRLRLRQSSAEVAEPRLSYDTVLVGFRGRSSEGAQWLEPRSEGGAVVRTLGRVEAQTSAVLVGVLEEPLFKKSSVVSVYGSLLYKQAGKVEGTEFQDFLQSEVTFRVEDVISGSFMPFAHRNSFDENDLVSVVVSSSCWQLCVRPRHRMAPPVSGALERAGLVQVKELGCWVAPCDKGGALAGLLIMESGTTPDGGHRLLVYAREMKQALLLVHSLQPQWRVAMFSEPPATVQDCVASVAAELGVLRSVTRPGAEHTAEQWAGVRDRLNTLELATDMTFASHMSSLGS